MSAASLHETTEDGTRRVTVTGRLTVRFADEFSPHFRDLEERPEPLHLDIAEVDRIDTVGAWVLFRLERERSERGYDTDISGVSENAQHMMDQVGKAAGDCRVRPPEMPRFLALLDRLGGWIAEGVRQLGAFLAFLGMTLLALAKIAAHPRRLRGAAMFKQAEAVGVAALGIIGLMSFLVGIVVAQQGAVQLRQFGAEVFVINLVGRITFRELGVLMTAIMVAGRSGSAFAAQIGSMKLAEEIDAMRTIGMPPIEVLVVPRLLASVIAMPLLAFYGSMMAIAGGALISWLSLGIPPSTFIQRIQEVVPITDVWVGLIKAPVFGLIIAVTGCFQGMQVSGNAEEVGRRTTAAVVQAIFLVIVLDAFFAVFFSVLGWI
ncbi:ABC transporter permease [Pacificimonas flava]|uniref:ABC transporter permease n=2 Tax=Pacificimonas TaxID=1960290 RepID=A0A219B4W3_9SPHN|nr:MULTISPECIES: MlaE family lipid ABC transporter permease subunit [Pacificimonas]MBZ6377086.1 MlaE family lipid ABC transporter permease subunit [Pacificimonas aurantium]OWV33183.1 ABC transporter permease [Pacificimonas flava]